MDYSNMSAEEIRQLREKRRRTALERARKQREAKRRAKRRLILVISTIIVLGIAGIIAYSKISKILDKARDKKEAEATTVYVSQTGITDNVYADVTDNKNNDSKNGSSQNPSTDDGIISDTEDNAEDDTEDNTETDSESVIDVINRAEAEDGVSTIKISIVGDCMIASLKGQITKGNFAWYCDNKPATYFMEDVSDYFKNDDLTIANCENVFTDRDLTMRTKNSTPAFWYKSKTKNAEILSVAGIDVVSLSNNHILDYLKGGKEDTIAAVEAANLEWSLDDKIYYYEKDGFTIAVVCIQVYAYWEVQNVVKYIQEASLNSDFQIVYFHGGKMKIHEVESWKQKAAHDFVDYGADLVVGSHPHVLQKAEVYNGVDIVYSLGNFCYGGNPKSENRTLIYQYELTIKDGVLENKEATMIPCYLYSGNPTNWKPSVITNEKEKQKVLDYMNGLTNSPL